ncbi:MAG: glyoxalase [Flavobacteriales bacterium]|nr:glyoxalase [Flavobacteriales bacterium]
MTRSQIIKKIRPKLELDPALKPAEAFQNNVLRPALKFQHEIIISVLKNMINKFDSNFNIYKKEKKLLIIRQIIAVDAHNKRFLLGLIMGMFTSEELDQYFKNQKEINKRTYSLLRKKAEQVLLV